MHAKIHILIDVTIVSSVSLDVIEIEVVEICEGSEVMPLFYSVKESGDDWMIIAHITS